MAHPARSPTEKGLAGPSLADVESVLKLPSAAEARSHGQVFDRLRSHLGGLMRAAALAAGGVVRRALAPAEAQGPIHGLVLDLTSTSPVTITSPFCIPLSKAAEALTLAHDVHANLLGMHRRPSQAGFAIARKAARVPLALRI